MGIVAGKRIGGMILEGVNWRALFLPAVDVVGGALLASLAIYAMCCLVQMGAALVELLRTRRQLRSVSPWWMLTSKVTLPISILVPAYNEEKVIVESVRSLLSLHYPNFEVIVCNDGSKDGTLDALINAFDLARAPRLHPLTVFCKPLRGIYTSSRFPRLTVIDKQNGGKSDALNAGLNLSRNPLVCVVDADSILEPDALLRMVRPFILEPEEMVAVGGRIRVANGCEVRSGRVVRRGLPRQFLPLIQMAEYIRSFQIARLSWSRMQSITIISGAFGLFKRSIMMEAGGYLHDTVGEDMEMTVRLHRHLQERGQRYKMRYLPDAVCWTEVPCTFKVLRAQRCRWQRGMLEVLYRHRDMIFSPRHGMAGFYGLGYFFLFDAVGPFLEALGFIIVPICWLTGLLNTPFFLSYMGLLFLFGVFVSVGSLYLEEVNSHERTPPKDLLILTAAACLENFGYRQLNSFWRIEAWWQFLRKKKSWGNMVRSGFRRVSSPSIR
jgi:cellulose synthase/poly-beta-1,6-N-acetylglucosamine synthase-like glycosyltransferase